MVRYPSSPFRIARSRDIYGTWLSTRVPACLRASREEEREVVHPQPRNSSSSTAYSIRARRPRKAATRALPDHAMGLVRRPGRVDLAREPALTTASAGRAAVDARGCFHDLADVRAVALRVAAGGHICVGGLAQFLGGKLG